MTNKRRDLRILWNSNGPHTGSGYAVFQKDLLSRLSADGWITDQIAFWGVLGAPLTYTDPPFDKGNSIKLYHKMADDYGSDAMYHHAKKFKYDVVFSFMDIPMINPQYLDMMVREQMKWIPYMPVDRDPVPPAVLDRLRYAYKIITYSQWGHDMLEKEGYTSKLILEGTDTSINKPADKVEARKKLGFLNKIPQDAFIWGMIAANKENPPRKGYQEALEAFKIFESSHPDAYLFIHTQQISPGAFPIVEYARHIGVDRKLIIWDQHSASFYDTTEDIVTMYNALDAYLAPSQTEGFALTPVEAMSCGKPVVVTDCTAMSELIEDGKTGYKAKIKHKWFTNQLAYQFIADSEDVAKKMELVYDDLKKDERKVAKACRQHVLKKYNIDTLVKDQWIPYLLSLQDEILGKMDSDGNTSNTRQESSNQQEGLQTNI